MNSKELGKLIKVDLREYWESEPRDFTPWLAREDNISLLGKTVGLKLETLEQEANVGPFRADILCRDTLSEALVLVENQLEPTNHTHLGQLMTYAAGLDTVYIIWIAQSFHDEHRAALDWLNRITAEHFHFFGVEIELWKIGDSIPAPKFNLISKPNEWSKAVQRSASGSGGPREETYQLREEYWASLTQWAKDNGRPINTAYGGRSPFLRFDLGLPGCHVYCSISIPYEEVSVGLTLFGKVTNMRYEQLEAGKDTIEQKIGVETQWVVRPEENKAWISLSSKVNFETRNEWPESHRWTVDNIEGFTRVFKEEISKIDE
jgi:uncharacterized protein DUF4268